LSPEQKKALRKKVKLDLKRSKGWADQYDSFDEEWILDNVKQEDKVYYGSDSDSEAEE